MTKRSNSRRHSTPKQLSLQLQAQAASILAEGLVLSSFKHKGLSGIEREEPIRRFLRAHLPGRFHVGQGSIASSERILEQQHDVIVADRDLCFLLLNTLNAQLMAIESVHLIVEVRSRANELGNVAKSFGAVRRLRANQGLRQLGNRGSDIGKTAPPVHTIVIFHGPKSPETLLKQLSALNAEEKRIGRRMAVDFVLVLAAERDDSTSSGYLIGYSRTDTESGHRFDHHLYPQVGQVGMDGPRVIAKGDESFGLWYAGILNHLSGVTVYPPNLYSYLGQKIGFLPWNEKPY